MHLTFANIIPHTYKYFNSDVAASRSEVMPCGIVKLLFGAVKLSVPHIVPKAHFTHEVRFTCDAYLTFRRSGTLSSKNAPLSVDKGAFFVGGGWWIRTTEVSDNRFTVCPLWPLGKSPLFYRLRPGEALELVIGVEPTTC